MEAEVRWVKKGWGWWAVVIDPEGGRVCVLNSDRKGCTFYKVLVSVFF